MKSYETNSIQEHGRAIARGMEEIKVEKQKNALKAEKRKATMLENAAARALSGS